MRNFDAPSAYGLSPGVVMRSGLPEAISNGAMRMRNSCVCALGLLLLSRPVAGQGSVVTVPVGAAPVIDGAIGVGEWDDAANVPLHGGEGLYVKRSGQHLYVAIRGSAGGIGSVCLGDNTRVRVLHASTGLITAEYYHAENRWSLAHGFRGPRRGTGERFARGDSGGEAYRAAQLEQFGWVANLVEQGPGTDMEYQIDLTDVTDSAVYMSVAFLQARAQMRVARAPASLDDGSLDTELIAGGARDGLVFVPTSWLELHF